MITCFHEYQKLKYLLLLQDCKLYKMQSEVREIMLNTGMDIQNAGFNPNQPRVPAGNSDGGQWTDGSGGGFGGEKTPPIPRIKPKQRVEVHNSQRITIIKNNEPSETRIGGSIAWRNNNPGNLRAGKFARDRGAIGENSGFAVFPDKETGDTASRSLFKTQTYTDLTINEAIARRSPANENNTRKLQRDIIADTDLSGDHVIGNSSGEQFNRLVNSIHKFEGWIEGEIIKE